jgi:hypothetical protein
MIKATLIATLAAAAVFVAMPQSSHAIAIAPAESAAVGDLGAIENVRWVRRCHTENRLRRTEYGRQWVPVRICNRVWERGRYRQNDRNRRYDRDDRRDRSYDREVY